MAISPDFAENNRLSVSVVGPSTSGTAGNTQLNEIAQFRIKEAPLGEGQGKRLSGPHNA
jgi:hypothetical protein